MSDAASSKGGELYQLVADSMGAVVEVKGAWWVWLQEASCIMTRSDVLDLVFRSMSTTCRIFFLFRPTSSENGWCLLEPCRSKMGETHGTSSQSDESSSNGGGSRSSRSASFPESVILVSSTADHFQDWVADYKGGKWTGDAEPAMPEALVAIEEELEGGGVRQPPVASTSTSTRVYSNFGSPMNSTTSLSSQSDAQALLQYYAQHGYFPAPKGKFETERLKTMKMYGLEQPNRKEAIERICRLAKGYFKTPTVLVSLIFEDHQVMAAENGWDPSDPLPSFDTPLRKIELPSAVCTHAMSMYDPKSTFIIGDTTKDWRFKRNPYAKAGLAFYASANIRLPSLAPASSNVPETLPVGTICLVDSVPRDASSFGASDREVLRDFAEMVAREFQLGYEQSRRTSETLQSDFLRDFLNDSLVVPSQPLQSLSNAIQKARELTKAGSAVLLDLRLFKFSTGEEPTSPSPEPVGGGIKLLACDGNVDWVKICEERARHLAVCMERCLTSYADSLGTKFEGRDMELCPFYGVDGSDGGGTASCFVPVYDLDGSPTLLLLLTSGEKFFDFDEQDKRFLQNVGGIIHGSLLKQRVVEADRAKLAFVSQISHDFRLPLHGVASNVELIREFSTPEQLIRLTPLLEACEVCLESLRDVLDDTLEFAKLSNSAPAPRSSKALATVDLEQLAEDVVRATWVRKRRVDLVSQDHGKETVETDAVEVSLEVQIKESWLAEVDVGGIKRVLLNLLGNALKFTTKGHVRLRLWEMPDRPDEPGSQKMIAVAIEDTGCGMSEKFLRDQLFTPFVQEDSFATGAGLGMSICQTILKRMGGTLDVTSTIGKGSIMRVSIPVTFVPLSPNNVAAASPPISVIPMSSPLTLNLPAPSPSVSEGSSSGASLQSIRSSISTSHSLRSTSNISWRRRVISTELGTLLTPAALPSATPKAELAGFDFNQVVQATQVSLEQTSLAEKPAQRPNIKRTVSTGLKVLGDRGDQNVTTIDAANLSLMAFQQAAPEKMVVQTKASIAPNVRVLVVEDNPLARNILSKLLSGKGVPYGLAEDGQQAVDAVVAERGAYNLILMDVQMPIKDGITASKEIRQYEQQQGLPRCRIIALSGLSVETDLINADGPIDAWLVKGGKSLRIIQEEISKLQGELEAKRNGGDASPADHRVSESRHTSSATQGESVEL